MNVVPFQSVSRMEVEGLALEKTVHLIRSLPTLIADHISALDQPEDSHERCRIDRQFMILEFIDRTFEQLELETGPFLDDCLKSLVSKAVFDIQCSLTNLRMRAFADIRASRLFIKDFSVMDEGDTPPPLRSAA